MLKKSSVIIAKSRLKQLVTSDRVQCMPNSYDNIRREIFDVLSKYMEITEENFQIEIKRTHIWIRFTGEKA